MSSLPVVSGPAALQVTETATGRRLQVISTKASSLVRILAAPALLFWLAAVGMQWLSGAYLTEFSAEPDESAHYVTSLMVRDYIVAGAPGSPMRFAERYYLHYPRVAFGVWPPGFHLTLAAWMVAFSGSRASVLVLMALLTALLATLLYLEASRRFGRVPAFGLGLILMAFPYVQESTSSVMADLELAVLVVTAALFYSRYLHTEKKRYAAAFGVLAAGAIMTKYNGIALAPFPFLAAALAGRLRLIRKFSFWLPALIVAGLCAPWYIRCLSMVRYAAEPVPGVDSIPLAAWLNTRALVEFGGPVLFGLACLGLYYTLVRVRHVFDPLWAAMAAVTISVWGFHSLAYPIPGPRYLVPAAPALLLFAAAGTRALATRAFRGWSAVRRGAGTLAVCAIAAGFLVSGYRLYRKPVLGYASAAERISAAAPARPVYLVAADATGEGAMVAEAALRDNRPGAIVLRSSKMLASATGMGANYRVRYRTPGEMLAFMDSAAVTHVIMQPVPTIPHHRQLLALMNSHPERWQQVGRFGPAGKPVEVYAFLHRAGSQPSGPLQVDMQYSLNRSIRE